MAPLVRCAAATFFGTTMRQASRDELAHLIPPELGHRGVHPVEPLVRQARPGELLGEHLTYQEAIDLAKKLGLRGRIIGIDWSQDGLSE